MSYSIDSAYSEFVRGFPLRDVLCLSVFAGGVFSGATLGRGVAFALWGWSLQRGVFLQ